MILTILYLLAISINQGNKVITFRQKMGKIEVDQILNHPNKKEDKADKSVNPKPFNVIHPV